MEKKNKKTLIFSVIVCLLPIIVGIVLYNKLPEQIPILYTINNTPYNYGHKNLVLFGLPILMAIVQVICLLVTNLKTNKLKNDEKPRILKIMEWIIPVLTVLTYIIIIEIPLGSTVYAGKSVCLILGIVFMIIGNYIPKINYEVGKAIIHPTPKSEKAFRKMSKIMGCGFIVIGIVFLIMIIWV